MRPCRLAPAYLLVPSSSSAGPDSAETITTSLIPIQRCVLNYDLKRQAQAAVVLPPRIHNVSYDSDGSPSPLADDGTLIEENMQKKRKREYVSSSSCSSSTTTTEDKSRKVAKLRVDVKSTKPQVSIETLMEYPLLFQNQMNFADSETFSKKFRDKCEEGVVIVSYYVDQQGNRVRKPPLRCWIGWVQYKRYLEELFNALIDIVFMIIDTKLLQRREKEIVIRSDFLLRGTHLQCRRKDDKVESQQSLFNLSNTHGDRRKGPPTSSHEFHLGDFTVLGGCHGSPYLSDSLLMDALSLFENDRCEEAASTSNDDDDSASSSLRWMGDSCSSSNQSIGYFATNNRPTSEISSVYILGHIMPYESKESCFGLGNGSATLNLLEVRITGKISFYINSITGLVRRIEFTCQQDLVE